MWQVAKIALPALSGAPSFRHEEARLEAELRVTQTAKGDDDDDDDDDEVTQPDTGLRGTKSKKRPRHQKAQVVRHGKRLQYKKRPGTRSQGESRGEFALMAMPKAHAATWQRARCMGEG